MNMRRDRVETRVFMATPLLEHYAQGRPRLRKICLCRPWRSVALRPGRGSPPQPSLDDRTGWSIPQCLSDSQCASGFCAQGVCCDSACQGPCVSCNLPQHVGICSSVPSGTTDPKAICVDQKASSCSTTGRCDGAGGCQKYSSTTICRAASCAAGVQTVAAQAG